MLDHPHIPDGAPPDLTPFELDVALLTLSTNDANAEDLAAALDIEPTHFLHTLARPHVAAFIHAAVALERFRFDLAASRAHAEALEALAAAARNHDNDIQKRAALQPPSSGQSAPLAPPVPPTAALSGRCPPRRPRSKTPPHTDTLTLLTTALEHFTTTSPGAGAPDPEATTLDQILAILPAPDPARILDACALPLRRAGLESILAAIPDLSAAAGAALAHERDILAENGRVVRQLTFLSTPPVPGGIGAEAGAITLEFTLHNFGYRTQRWRITDITHVEPLRPHDTHDPDTDDAADFDNDGEGATRDVEYAHAATLLDTHAASRSDGHPDDNPHNNHDPP